MMLKAKKFATPPSFAIAAPATMTCPPGRRLVAFSSGNFGKLGAGVTINILVVSFSPAAYMPTRLYVPRSVDKHFTIKEVMAGVTPLSFTRLRGRSKYVVYELSGEWVEPGMDLTVTTQNVSGKPHRFWAFMCLAPRHHKFASLHGFGNQTRPWYQHTLADGVTVDEAQPGNVYMVGHGTQPHVSGIFGALGNGLPMAPSIAPSVAPVSMSVTGREADGVRPITASSTSAAASRGGKPRVRGLLDLVSAPSRYAPGRPATGPAGPISPMARPSPAAMPPPEYDRYIGEEDEAHGSGAEIKGGGNGGQPGNGKPGNGERNGEIKKDEDKADYGKYALYAGIGLVAVGGIYLMTRKNSK